jgi:type II secretion system protein I
MNRKFKKKYSAGFTLIELLVAISILSISILAAYTAVSNNIKGQTFAEDQVIAYYLADEGIESIRNIRDQNNIANIVNQSNGSSQVSWLSGISSACVGTSCSVDSPLLKIAACPGDSTTCPYLNMNTTSGLYGYTASSGWVTTQFKRGISVQIISGTEIKVMCTVSWVTNGVPKSYVLSENMLEWE